MTHEEFFKATGMDLTEEQYEYVEELYLASPVLQNDFCNVMAKIHLIPNLAGILFSAGENIQSLERRLIDTHNDLVRVRKEGDEALESAIERETAYIAELCRVGASVKARAICKDAERVLRVKVAQKLALDEADFELLGEIIAPEL